jgi:ABC-type phosphate transport system substrate-binding protein
MMMTQISKWSAAFGALAVAAVMTAVPGACAGELVVVVSAKNPVAAMDTAQVAHIFLAKTGRFPGGGEVSAIDLPVGSAQRNTFYSKVTGMSPPLVKSYWSKMVFTGRGQPPKVAADSVAVRRMVADNPLLIGYIDRAALDDSVREVLVVD